MVCEYICWLQLSHPWNRWQMPAALDAWILRWAWGRLSMLGMMTDIRFAFFHLSPKFQNDHWILYFYGMVWFLGALAFLQLECIACGNSWYASRDEVSALTIDASDSKRSIGTAPLATAKFEDAQKKLVSPRETENSVDDINKKSSESQIPVLDAPKSFSKPRKDDNIEAKRHAD